MMTRRTTDSRNCFEIVSIEDLVPKDHLVRKVDKALDFDFIYPLVESMYSSQGRPSIDPIILFKMVFIQYLFGIRSMRQTIKNRNKYGLPLVPWARDFEKVPHFLHLERTMSEDSKIRMCSIKSFTILNEAYAKGFIDDEVIFIDSTHIKANANKHTGKRIEVEQEAKVYQKNLRKEINEVRVAAGKSPLISRETGIEFLKNISRTDSESGYFVKGEKERCLFCTYRL